MTFCPNGLADHGFGLSPSRADFSTTIVLILPLRMCGSIVSCSSIEKGSPREILRKSARDRREGFFVEFLSANHPKDHGPAFALDRLKLPDDLSVHR